MTDDGSSFIHLKSTSFGVITITFDGKYKVGETYGIVKERCQDFIDPKLRLKYTTLLKTHQVR